MIEEENEFNEGLNRWIYFCKFYRDNPRIVRKHIEFHHFSDLIVNFHGNWTRPQRNMCSRIPVRPMTQSAFYEPNKAAPTQ